MAVKLHRLSLSTRSLQNNYISANVNLKGQANINGIIALCRESRMQEALMAFRDMNNERGGIEVDSDAYASLLQACAHMKALSQGMQIHACILKFGILHQNVNIENNMMTMYCKCGELMDSMKMFDKMSKKNVFSWNVIIATYVRHECYRGALGLWFRMQQAGMQADHFTFPSLLKACAAFGSLRQGREMHGSILRAGLQSHVVVASALVAMYGKFGRIEDAQHVFEKMLERDVVSWNAMISGFCQVGNSTEALKVFRDMQLAGVKVDSATIPSILSSYGQSAALQQGKGIHSYVITCGFDLDVAVGNALIDMYAKCGCLEDAHQVFRKMSQANVISWTAMISGFGLHGRGEDALRLFHQMQELGMRPNDVTFTAVLSACSHAGLVDKGWRNFNQMNQDYRITPTVEHYACMVDLLGRSGRLDEAKSFIQSMPLEPKPCVWGALLGACRMHCNVELGEHAAENLFNSEPTNAGNYVVLSNIYAAAGRWDGVAKVRTLMRERGLTKKPGCSWIEIRSRIHTFFQGDKSHPQTKKIYATLECLFKKMKESGYVPETDCVIYKVDNKEKEYILNSHSEKLAIAFGLINTFPGTPILIIKNLRVCSDCHTATKFISKIVDREIIVRDATRFHHFKNGLCSCGDYW